MGTLKTTLLMIAMMLLFMYIGNIINGTEGMTTAFYAACATNIFSYFFSDTMVLNHYKAHVIKEKDNPELYQIVKNLSQRAGLPMPKVCIVPENVPNAFATGRNPKHAAVAVTQGLLQTVNKEELEGVLAHEMSHINHHDILIGTIASVFAGAITMIGNFARLGTSNRQGQHRGNNIMLVIMAPIAASLIQMCISRTREYEADAGAAKLTGHPEWLIAALEKLENYAKSNTMSRATPQTAHMFIVNPFSGISGILSSLFSTHPSTKNRIERLRRL